MEYQYTEIRDAIWQIEDDDGVCVTLIRGNEMAVLVDTGYGKRNLRGFVESQITTPYMVINSHGHPDHIGGNRHFDRVWALREEADVIRHFEITQAGYSLQEITAGQRISLGNLHVRVVLLAGHTRGSIGLLVEEEGLLVAGDALNEGLWLFNYGSLSMKELAETIRRTLQLEFRTYLCGHSREEYPKQKLRAHLKNIESVQTAGLCDLPRDITIGFETYHSVYEDADGRSELVFTADKIGD